MAGCWPVLEGIAQAAPALAMLACFACVGGGGYLIAKRRDRTKGVLMLVMAAVLLGNVLIWTM
ncbi:hypothetical protein SAMN05216557_102333 [Sphingomonas carotinifaciens]|uniref:Uncharacterized protein n=1 Tax=Sphingomonas carotinifaciens TaxID=1166323 RepID=A0A1G7IPH9_9SPHN|nr:hypothetical protein [Sphingomonas carotinifaciens]MWC44174.1 hypothetical protein [Sphingomonas carotinifaciens]SDF14650.1 hypothetical protein SAMN05216557_102333 [Sphingomonas carotinifaciens]